MAMLRRVRRHDCRLAHQAHAYGTLGALRAYRTGVGKHSGRNLEGIPCCRPKRLWRHNDLVGGVGLSARKRDGEVRARSTHCFGSGGAAW